MSLYNCHSVGNNEWRLVKWDDMLNIEAVYHIGRVRGRFNCQCFAGNKPSCRHRDMLHQFIYQRYVDTATFFNFETGLWVTPVAAQ